MKRYLFGRIFGILLAGILMVESSIPVFATETATESPQVETVQEVESEEAAEDEIVEEENEVESSKQESVEFESSETKTSEVTPSESKEMEDSKVDESVQEEESPSAIETSEEEKSETVETSTEESSEEKTSSEVDAKEETTVAEEESISEEAETVTEEETEEEAETTTEEMTEELPEIMLFTANARTAAPTTAPSGVSVVDRTATTATILWKTIDGYIEYQIHRSNNADTGFTLLEGATIETTSNVGAFLDTSCESGKVYYYKICAVVTSEGEVVGQGPFSEVISNSVALQQVTLSKVKVEMKKGEESVLAISYAPSYAEGMYNVTWSTDNSKVATVTDGKITAVGAGTATITAKVGDKTATCEVTVSMPLEQLVLNTKEVNLIKGESVDLSVSLKPEDTTDEVVLTWSSSDEKVATITQDNENGKLAKITAVSEGTAIITVSSGEVTAECKVHVNVPITDFKLSEYSVQLLENNDSVNVSILVDTTDEIECKIDDEQLVECEINDRILTVRSLGRLGTTQVHITIGAQTVVLNVQVVEERQIDEITSDMIPVSDITLTAIWMKKGEDKETNKVPVNLYLENDVYSVANISAKISPSNATNQEITWSSTNKSVVSVDENGTVNAVGIGRANIIATADNGVTEKITVIVLPGEENFEIEDKKITLYCNEELPEKVSDKGTYLIPLSEEMSYEYRSSNDSVATVDTNGLITAQNPGNAIISVIGKENGDVQTIQVAVKRMIESIEVPLDEITVMNGTQPEISFKVFPADASTDLLNTINIKAENNSSKVIEDITWTKGKTSGTIKFSAMAEKETDAQIIITVGDTGNTSIIQKVIKVKIKKEPSLKVASIKVSGLNKMQSDTEQTLGITVKDNGGNELIASDIAIGFTSSNPEVATVDENGTVHALEGGKTTITAYVMNGSNIKVDYAITVEQRLEAIIFDRTVYGVSKAVNKSATVTVQPRFVPATTVNKSVTWSVAQVTDANGDSVEGTVTDYFTVDANGKVTAKAKATEGMQAVITCTSKAYAANEDQVTGTVTVEVQPKKVTAVKFTKTTVEAVGLGEHNLAFSTTFATGYSEAEYEVFTSDSEIATAKVENGQVVVVAHKYGTVTVTLCADQAITATCKVTVYPVARGAFVAKEASYLLQQAQYNGNDRVQLQFVDSKTKKNIVDSKLFSYQSSNPDIVYVDENGVAYANAVSDGKITTKNNQVTITATLKDDPDKRKVTAKVIVCPTEQIERMDVSYYPTTSAAISDKYNTGGTILADSGAGMIFSKTGQQFVLRVTTYGADSERIANPQLTFTSSDTSLAIVASQTMKSFTDDENQKYQVWEAVITVKQAGRFSINVAAKDQKKYTRSINFVAYSAKPILVSGDLGTINRNAKVVMLNDMKGQKESIASDKTFKIFGSDGTEVTFVSVASAKVKLKSSNKIATVPAKKFAVREIGNNEYRLYMLESEMDNVADGTYTITLNVKRTLLGTEDDEPGYVDEPDTTTASLDATFKIASTIPKLSAVKITLNTFIKGDSVKIPINTTETIESVTIASGMMLAKELDVFKQGKDWYAKIRDDAFDNWKKTSTSGVLYVKLKGYETPIAMNLNVTCKSTKPTVKQLEVPSIQLQHGGVTYVTLIDGQKNVWEDYTIERKSSTATQIFAVKCQDDDNKTTVTFIDTNMKLKNQGVTLTEKVLVSKDEWRSPIELSISVKAYNGASVPTVGFEKTTININKAVEESAETKVKISHSNVVLNGDWTISENCMYKNTKNEKVHASEAFSVEYADGVVKVSLIDNDIPNGTYKLTMTNLWDASNDANPKKPLTTSTLTVVVKNVAPTVIIKMSGQLDLVKRSKSTLKGTITVSNTNATVKRVRLVDNNGDGFDEKFYCTRKDNTFIIYARSSAVLTTTKITGKVEVIMSDGTKSYPLYQTITFTPTQSTPSVITPANETIYKSASSKTVKYNFNEKLTEGVRIADIKAICVPAGLKVQDSNGYLYVTLDNKTLKQGKYKIVVNVYFKGAQAISSDTQGKAVQKTIYVEVKE